MVVLLHRAAGSWPLVSLGRSQLRILDSQKQDLILAVTVWGRPHRRTSTRLPARTQADPLAGVQSARRRLGARLWISHVGQLIGGAGHHPLSLPAGAGGSRSGRSPDGGFLEGVAAQAVGCAAHDLGTQGEVAYVLRMRMQSVAAKAVAEAAADLASAGVGRDRRAQPNRPCSSSV